MALTSDVIVGFPGETYEDFAQTLSLIREVRFDSLFTFIYSPREGTPAAALPDPVSREEKGKWFDELLRTQEVIGKENIRRRIGTTCRVLCDGKATAEGWLSGHTPGTAVAEFEGDESLIGQFVEVELTGFDNAYQGKVIEQ